MTGRLSWRRDIAEGLFWVGASLSLSWLVAPHLPDRVPVHFNWRWQPDGWGSKGMVLWLVPATLAGIWAVLTVCLWLAEAEKGQLRLDAGGRRWTERVRSGLGMTFLALHASLLGVGLGWLRSPRPILMPVLGLLFLVIGQALPHLPRNWVAGVRLPWTLVDERVWTPVHRFAGRGFEIVGLLFLIAPLLPHWWDLVPLIGLVLLVLALVSYAYWLYRRVSGSGTPPYPSDG